MDRFWLLAHTTQKLTRFFPPALARSCSFTAAAALIA